MSGGGPGQCVALHVWMQRYARHLVVKCSVLFQHMSLLQEAVPFTAPLSMGSFDATTSTMGTTGAIGAGVETRSVVMHEAIKLLQYAAQPSFIHSCSLPQFQSFTRGAKAGGHI